MERYTCKCGCGKIIGKARYKRGVRFFNCKHANVYNGIRKIGKPLKRKEDEHEDTVD